jgi:membrane fusion protein, multidrug efflux system
MKDDLSRSETGSITHQRPSGLGPKAWIVSVTVLMVLATAGALALYSSKSSTTASAAAPPAPVVTVSTPLQRDITLRLEFLGQFSAVQRVELRAQVGGTLTEIRFKDGDIVRKGDLLFVIDPTPYEIRLSQAAAQLETANARLDLATRELIRAETLKRDDAGSAQNVDQRAAEKRGAQAAVEAAKASIRDARFDLDHTRITAPFTGRIGTHLVSVGNLVAGSRAGSSPTTLLATLVSLDPIYLNFDMSESDYMTFLRQRATQKRALANSVDVSLIDETRFDRRGTLNFIDNALNRSSGTIHARASVPNSDLLLTPGGFARVRLALSTPEPTLLVPDASVLADQSEHVVLTVEPDNVVVSKTVQLGDLRSGLRVIRSGLASSDKVIIDGIPTVTPGSKVSPQVGSIQLGAEEELKR